MKRTRWLWRFCLLLLAGCAAPGGGAGSVPTVETGVDPAAWVRVPAGEFLQGQHEQETAVPATYEIMVTDVTNTQYAEYLNAALADGTLSIGESAVLGHYPGDPFHGHRHEVEIPAGEWLYLPLENPAARLVWNGSVFSVLPGFENHPATLVSWFGAWGYCGYYGWRLPTDVEWEKAARGTDNRAFPWGDELVPQNANYLSSNDIFERLFEGAGGTTPVGFYNGRRYEGFETVDSASPYGLYDMAGNVWQWTGDVREGAHYRSLRGGSHNNYGYNLRVWTENNAGPGYYSPSVGFRCARNE